MALGSTLFLVFFVLFIIGLFFLFRVVQRIVKVVISVLLIVILIWGSVAIYKDISAFNSEQSIYLLENDGAVVAAFHQNGDDKTPVADLTQARVAYPDGLDTLLVDNYKVVVVGLDQLDDLESIQAFGGTLNQDQYLAVLTEADLTRRGWVFIFAYDDTKDATKNWFIHGLKDKTVTVTPRTLAFKLPAIMPDFLIG
jgi:hypothetical protein